MCSDIITVDEAFLLVLSLRVCETRGEGPHYKLPRDVHLLMVIYSDHDNLFTDQQNAEISKTVKAAFSSFIIFYKNYSSASPSMDFFQ